MQNTILIHMFLCKKFFLIFLSPNDITTYFKTQYLRGDVFRNNICLLLQERIFATNNTHMKTSISTDNIKLSPVVLVPSTIQNIYNRTIHLLS